MYVSKTRHFNLKITCRTIIHFIFDLEYISVCHSHISYVPAYVFEYTHYLIYVLCKTYDFMDFKIDSEMYNLDNTYM